MNIGIITFHFVTNQGAVLQCYALQTYLEKLGHHVSIINYQPRYHTVRYAAWKNPFVAASVRWRKNSKLNVIKRTYAYLFAFLGTLKSDLKRTDTKKVKIFESFTNQYLHVTPKYRTLASLQSNYPEMDIYISGSDQLWNPDLLNNGFDPAYFLDFGSDNIYKMTYAVSMKESFSAKEKKQLAILCKHLNSIGIREDNPDLVDSVNQPVNVLVDPTLLLDLVDYAKIEAPRLEAEPYVFVYGFENLKDLDNLVCEVSQKKKMKVINGSPNRIFLTCNCDKVYNYGPSEFLSYVKNADFVITNSFHGTAFSVIYKKQFVVFPHTTRGKRMIRLMEILGLKQRIWNQNKFRWWEEVDYINVDKELLKLREHSYSYLHNNLALASSFRKV